VALIKDGQQITDPFVSIDDDASLPVDGAVIVSLERWHAEREVLLEREDALGIKLRSDQSPDLIGDGLQRIALVALEFPAFRDGRAYSYARLLREKYDYRGELRAVGDVLLEQLHFMLRTGIDAFELHSDNPMRDFEIASQDFSIWYQPTADGRRTATDHRQRR